MSRRLGERDRYERDVGLARAVHSDYHESLLLLAFHIGLERTTGHGDIIPMGPESASYVMAAGKTMPGAHDFPRDRDVDRMDRAVARMREIAAVKEAVVGLRDYKPHGELMAALVEMVCMGSAARYTRRRGWRHVGPDYERAVKLCGGDDGYWRTLTDAWGIIAVLAVEVPVLAAAQAPVLAFDAKALAWARELGLRPSVG